VQENYTKLPTQLVGLFRATKHSKTSYTYFL